MFSKGTLDEGIRGVPEHISGSIYFEGIKTVWFRGYGNIFYTKILLKKIFSFFYFFFKNYKTYKFYQLLRTNFVLKMFQTTTK